EVTLSGTVSDPHLTTVEVFDNGSSLGLATVDSGAGTWTLTTSVGEGTHNNWSVTATDAAGNDTSASNTTEVVVDTTDPSVAFTNVAFTDTGSTDDVTSNGNVTLSGTVSYPHLTTVEVFDNGNSLGLATVSAGS